MSNIASFDVGHRSLSICVATVEHDIKCILNWWIKNNTKLIKTLDQLDELSVSQAQKVVNTLVSRCSKLVRWFEDSFKVIYMSRIDMFPDISIKNTNVIQRARATKSALYQIDTSVSFDKVLIEDQTINKLSSEVMYQIAYHYSDNEEIDDYVLVSANEPDICKKDKPHQLIIQDPRLKNLITIGPDLEIGKFYAENKDLYEANKKHAKANFEQYISIFGSTELKCSYAKLTRKNSRKGRDVADSFMQLLSHVIL